jgi:hypothetical protein
MQATHLKVVISAAPAFAAPTVPEEAFKGRATWPTYKSAGAVE